MQIIQDNPYRTVGLLVGATAKEQDRQIRRLKQFIEAGQDPQDDFSFPKLGVLNRTVESVTEAASKLNFDSDKMNAALFWFYNGNGITDEPAFDAIKDGTTDTAIEIWRKLAYDSEGESYNEVTKRNASAFHNLSTLYLQEYGIDEDTLQLKLLFLESDFFNELKIKATDETYRISKKELQLLFLNSLTQHESFDTSEFIETISVIKFSAKEDFLNGFVQKPIEQLERLLNECKAHRKSKKEDVIVAGTNLYNAAKPILTQLKGILGTSNLKYTSISDKISDEVLQCGIQLFNDFKDHKTYDPGEPAMQLFAQAKSLALGSIVKQRCQENTENLQEWIDDKPERDKQNLIGDDLQFITSKLEGFQNLSDTVANAKDLVDSCKPRLSNIKNALGSFDEFYLKISSAIVNNAQGMLVTAVNEAQEGFKNYNSFYELSSIVNSAYDVTTSMQSMDMVPNLKQSFQKNREALGSIRSQINAATSRPTSSSPSGSSGCYIATMAYGDYNHPQVMILRQFRDKVLDKSAFGKWFIKTYYYYSPKLVAKLKNKRTVNTIIRTALNQFIKFIK